MLRWSRAVSVAILALGSSCAGPAVQPLGPSASPLLGADEGLLILHVDSNVPIADLQLNRGSAAKSVARGHHVWLVRASAGSYRWTTLRLGSDAGSAQSLRLEHDDEFAFQVLPGKINYPGALIVRAHPTARSAAGAIRVRNRNHAAMAVRTLRDRHAALIEEYPLVYAGTSGDSFLDHYIGQRDALRAEAP